MTKEFEALYRELDRQERMGRIQVWLNAVLFILAAGAFALNFLGH